jgi:hypothetical protein
MAVVLLLTITDPRQHGKVYAILDVAVERFRALEEHDRVGFKDALNKFVRTYAFLSQIVTFTDSKLERDYTYCRALASKLRDETTIERLDLGTEVELQAAIRGESRSSRGASSQCGGRGKSAGQRARTSFRHPQAAACSGAPVESVDRAVAYPMLEVRRGG